MNNLRIILVILAFAYWNFPVYLATIPIWINQVIYNALPLLYLLTHRTEIIALFKKAIKYEYFIYMFYFALFFLGWSIATLVYNNSSDYSYFGQIFMLCRNIYVYIFLFMLSSELTETKGNLATFSWFWGASITFCVAFTIFTVLFLDFRATWQTMLVSSSYNEELTSMASQITRFSIGGFAGYGQTIVCSIGVVLSLFLIRKGCQLGILFLLFSLIGNLFYGRIGVLLSSIAIIVWLFKNINLRNIGKYFIFITAILIAANAFFETVDDPFLNLWIQWLTNPIDSFFYGLQYGQISFGESADNLTEDMYFMPEITTLIFGDGKYMNGDGSYYMNTDAGYMRIVLYSGIIGAIFLYMFYIILFLWAKQVNKYDKDIKYICEMLFLFFFIEEYKGDAYSIIFGFVAMLILCG